MSLKYSNLMIRSKIQSFMYRNFRKSSLLSHRTCFTGPTENLDENVMTMNEVKQKIIKSLGIKLGFSPILTSREHLLKYEPKLQSDLPSRSMQDSFTSAILPLTNDVVLQDKYVTFLGHVRLGRLMEDMDLFAVWVVHQHIQVPNLPEDVSLPYTFVTILVDKVDFTDLQPKYDADVRLSGHVSWVGKSSIEVVVWLEQKHYGKWEKLTRALFLMAARNATNTKAAVVNQLIPKSEEELKIFAGGENRKKRRFAIQNMSLLKNEPNDYEQKLIHDLFIKTIDMQDKTFNKRVLPVFSMWMEDSKLSNIIFSHPEDRNAHNKVFGGFLMRHALELSWAAGYYYSKHRPKLERISDIGFHSPVDVSSFIKMTAHVIYTEMQYMEIVVVAQVFDAANGSHTTTNVFYYTYSTSEKVKSVIPKTYHEAMWYLDGRRKFNYSMGLEANDDKNNI